MIELVKVV